MSSTGQKAPSSRGKASPRRGKRGPAKRKLAGAPRASRKQALGQVEELEALYRPLREAGEAELSKTRSGRALLESTRAHGAELGELYESIAGSKTPLEAGHRLARRRREEFTQKHQEQFLDAYAPHARLQPSVEAVARILRPEETPRTAWVAEARSPGTMLLQPKPVPGGEHAYPTQGLVPADTVAPDDLGTVSQGVGDPMAPQPVRACLGAPYPLQEEHYVAAPVGFASTGAFPSGRVMADGWAFASPFIPAQATVANAWVAQDFKVPAGITYYTATVDYKYDFFGLTAVGIGLAVISLNVAILIDKGDGRPPTRDAYAINLLIVPAWGNERILRSRSETATVPFGRAGSSTQPNVPSNGTVRVWVGTDAHCVGVGLFAYAEFVTTVDVKSVCVNSDV
jgi:hypothetical protein